MVLLKRCVWNKGKSKRRDFKTNSFIWESFETMRILISWSSSFGIELQLLEMEISGRSTFVKECQMVWGAWRSSQQSSTRKTKTNMMSDKDIFHKGKHTNRDGDIWCEIFKKASHLLEIRYQKKEIKLTIVEKHHRGNGKEFWIFEKDLRVY